MAFAEAEWLRLNIPMIFRTFWLLRCTTYVYVYLAATPLDAWMEPDSLKILFKIILIRGCETLPAILGMSSIFSWIAGKVPFASNCCLSFFSSRQMITLLHVRFF